MQLQRQASQRLQAAKQQGCPKVAARVPSRRHAAKVQAYLPAAGQSSFVGSAWSRTLSQQISTAGRVTAGVPMR
jgi:hypothetical protein